MRTTLALYRALKSVKVSDENAKAVAEALEADMQSLLATKEDVQAVRAEIKALAQSNSAEFQAVRGEIKSLEQSTSARFDLLDHKFQNLIQILKWGLGVGVSMAIALGAAAIRFIPVS